MKEGHLVYWVSAEEDFVSLLGLVITLLERHCC